MELVLDGTTMANVKRSRLSLSDSGLFWFE